MLNLNDLIALGWPGIQYGANPYLIVRYLCVSICIFCSRVLIFVMLHVIHVNGHGVVMISCTPWYRSCSIVKLIVCIIVSNV